MSEKERSPREASEASRSHGVSTVVRATHGRTDEFPIKVGLHQGTGLSPFVFIVALDVISEEFKCWLPNDLLFADDLAVITDTEEQMQRSWLGWQIGTKSQYRENGRDGQQQERNKSKHQRQPRHEPQTGE